MSLRHGRPDAKRLQAESPRSPEILIHRPDPDAGSQQLACSVTAQQIGGRRRRLARITHQAVPVRDFTNATDRMLRARGKPDQIPAVVKPVKIDVVGNYALHFTWSDGHNTGIYSYDYLRSL